MRTLFLCFLAFMALPDSAEAAADLSIQVNQQTKKWTLEELRHLPGIRTLEIAKDPSYPQSAHSFEAVPVASLFAGITMDPKGSLLFHCEDGFAAPISIPLVLNQDPKKAVAYIALEDPAHPWPALGQRKGTAGPFYLVWDHPERSHIGNEEWPFQLKGFTWQASAEEKYPHTVPDAKYGPESAVGKGYAVFQKNCFSCHRLNGEGEATQMGPDLNIPFGPTEYLAKGFLEKLVRNPQDLRKWKESRMPAFGKDVLSDEDFHHLEAYLRHMTGRKVKGS